MPPQPTLSPRSSQSIILIVALFIILLIIAFAMSTMPKKDVSINQVENPNSPQTIQKPLTVEVKKTDLVNTQGTNRLPLDFPSTVPVDVANIYDSYTATYPTATQATVSYLTDKSIANTYTIYHDYMKKSGYVFRPAGEDVKNGILYGTLANNDLSILITPKDGKTSVQISFFKRK